MLNDQGQTLVTYRSPVVLPPAKPVPRKVLTEDELRELMLKDAAATGRKLPKLSEPKQHYKGPQSDWQDPDTNQGKVYGLMADGTPRTSGDVGRALGLSTQQAGNALSNIASSYGAVVRSGYRDGIVLWRLSEAAE